MWLSQCSEEVAGVKGIWRQGCMYLSLLHTSLKALNTRGRPCLLSDCCAAVRIRSACLTRSPLYHDRKKWPYGVLQLPPWLTKKPVSQLLLL